MNEIIDLYFNEIIAPIIKKKETGADYAKEFLFLREKYGKAVTFKRYCQAKVIDEGTLRKHVKQLKQEEDA